jgi:hypothetical protein
VHAAPGELFRAPDVIDVVGIAAVDEDVTRRKMRQQVGNRAVDGGCRDHQPDGPRRESFFTRSASDEGADGLVLGELGDRVRRAIEDHALMAAGEQPPGHVGAHAPKSDHSKLHSRLLQ